MEWRKIKTIAELKHLIPIIHKIDTNQTTLFNSFQWIDLWFKNFFQNNWKLQSYIVFDNHVPIAFLPFYTQCNSNFLSLNSLYLLGQGEPEISEISSEYNDIYIARGYEEKIIQVLSTKLRKMKIDQIISKASFKNSNISVLLEKMFNYQAEISHSRYLVDIDSWSLDILSKNTRSKYKRSINQLNNIDASFKWIDKSEYEYFSHTLAKFHQTRWSNKGKSGAFAKNEFGMFHKNFRDANPDNVIMSAIIINNIPIAINYYLVDKTTLYFYQSGWDEKNYATFSPGFSLHLWSIENTNYKFYDFMMGNINDSYKAKFGCLEYPMVNNHVIVNKWKYKLHQLARKLLKLKSN